LQDGAHAVALSGWRENFFLSGGAKRSLPKGASAYGIPNHWRTFGAVELTKPVTGPDVVRIVRSDPPEYEGGVAIAQDASRSVERNFETILLALGYCLIPSLRAFAATERDIYERMCLHPDACRRRACAVNETQICVA
jgi:hypothetical protein